MYYIYPTTVFLGKPYLPDPVVAARDSRGPHTILQRNVKSSTKGLSHIGNVRLAVWGPRDPSQLWLETLSDVASSRSQWRSCAFSLALSSWRHLNCLFMVEFPSPILDMT